MGKSQKVETEGFDLLNEANVSTKTQEEKVHKEDVYNLLGTLKLNYSIKKSRNGKTNITLNVTSADMICCSELIVFALIGIDMLVFLTNPDK